MTTQYAKQKKWRDDFKARDPIGYAALRRSQARRYYAKNKEKLDARNALWISRNKDKINKKSRIRRRNQTKEQRASEFLKCKYGITYEQKMSLLAEQGGICPVCKTNSPMKLRGGADGWTVDHCHAYEKLTGGIKIRGILCSICNTLLGMARDNREILMSAIRYLDKHQTS